MQHRYHLYYDCRDRAILPPLSRRHLYELSQGAYLLDMVTESKPLYFTFATAGHVDHGKTSLLRALTGIDPDRLKEEKQRQMTTDIGFAHLNFPQEADGSQLVIGFIDVPGHGKFLKNMLAGVGGIQMALLVVAADEGPMPQTVSHVKILSLLGVRKALVALTKIDMASDDRQTQVEGLVQDLLQRYSIDCVDVVRISNTTSIGFDKLKSSLKNAAANLETVSMSEQAILPVDRVFSKSGYGVVVTGTLVSGQLKVGDTISIEPGAVAGRVRGLETFKRQLQVANAGQRLALNLALKENKTLSRGQVVANWSAPVVSTIIALVEQVGPKSEWIKASDLDGQQIRFYHGTAECAGTIRWCQQDDEDSNFVAQIVLTDPVVAEPGDRFVLRYGDEGITGGAVLLTNRPRWLTRNKLNIFTDLLRQKKFAGATEYFLENMTQPSIKASELPIFLSKANREAVVEECLEAKSIIQLNEHLLSSNRSKEIKERVLKLVGSISSETAGTTEHSIESLRVKISSSLDRHVFQTLIKDLSDAGRLIREGDKIRLNTGSKPALSPAQSATATQIAQILSENLCLEIEEISKRVKTDRKSLTAILQQMSKEDKAHIVDHDFASSAESLRLCHEALATIWIAKKEISPSEFRESMGTSRKYAMALLAYFDNKLITRRLNNTRVLIKTPKSD